MMTLILLLIGLHSTELRAEVQDPCLNTEHWSLPSSKNPNWLKEFHEFTASRSTPIYAWTRAVQLKRISQILSNADLEHDFSEYWVGRILYDMKIDPLAHQALQSVFENSVNPDLKKAAYSCLARIKMRTPDLEIPSYSHASQLHWSEADSDVLFISLFGLKSSVIQKLAPAHKAFLEGISALKEKKYSDAIFGLQAYFKYQETHSNAILDRYKDEAHLMLGRALYSVARFDEAALQFQMVAKKSNEQIEAMSNLAWAYLLNERYDDAVGVSLQLRAGLLKNTFAPEPLMVAAMALNEVCNYPDSIRMIQSLVHDYQSTHDWLRQHPNNKEGYVLSLQSLKGKSTAPQKLVTEWIRSPEFLTRQKEINGLMEQPKRFLEIENTAAIEQARLTKQFLEHASNFTKDVKIAKLQLKSGEELNSSFADRYLVVKKELRLLSHFYRASKTWKNLAKVYEKRIPNLKAKLVARVNQDLAGKNAKFLSLLNHIRDNSDLIEVEIYNGASQDLVWKNAHPKFDTENTEFTESKETPDAGKTWNWGRFTASTIEESEVWEDEMGALKADVTNQCNQKEKFLKLGQLKRQK